MSGGVGPYTKSFPEAAKVADAVWKLVNTKGIDGITVIFYYHAPFEAYYTSGSAPTDYDNIVKHRVHFGHIVVTCSCQTHIFVECVCVCVCK